jgi:solute carrier family 25 carnitine/acylcarnitine transporter 20/29
MTVTTKEQSTQQVWREVRGFIAGYCSGIALVMVGHPFDTVIVRMSSEGLNGRFKSSLDCLKSTVSEEGALAVYKGVIPPLLMTGGVNAILFGMQTSIVNNIFKQPGQPATVQDSMQAAVLSGGIISLLVAPMERIKARLQVQYSGSSAGVIETTKQVIKETGLRQGLYRGWMATAFCRMSNWAYFGSYAYISKIVNPSGEKTMATSVLSGGLAGVCYWFSCYPMVVVKNRMQASSLQSPVENFRLSTCVKSIFQKEGVRGFFVGFTPCVLRAVPANAAAFTAFEMAMRTLP